MDDDDKISFEITPVARRRAALLVTRDLILSIGAVAAIAIVIAGRLTPVIVGLIVVVAIGSVANPVRQARARRLEMTAETVTYRDAWFTLAAPWDDVTALVRLRPTPSALALRLDTSALVTEKKALFGAPWRRQPYPFDRTIPLEPFIDGDPTDAVIARLREFMPELFDGEPMLEPGPPVTTRWRILGVAAGLVPLALGGAVAIAWFVRLPLDAATARLIVIEAIILAGVLIFTLWRRVGTTGERMMDYIGRSLAAPRAEEPRIGMVRVVAPTYVRLLVFVAMGASLGLLETATTRSDLESTFGPPHTCYFDSNRKISGCLMSTGITTGTATGTLITCYFHEPLPVDTVTFHCIH